MCHLHKDHWNCSRFVLNKNFPLKNSNTQDTTLFAYGFTLPLINKQE